MAVDIPKAIVRKLIFFTAAMVFFPLITFFTSQWIFASSVVSGGLAALMANVVLIGYIIVAFTEEVKLEPVDDNAEKDGINKLD